MGSVIDRCDCPRCKSEAYTEFWYKSGEEWIYCEHCGYEISSGLKRNEEGKAIDENGNPITLLEDAVMETTETKEPYCAFRIETDQGFASQGTCLTKEQWKECYKHMQQQIAEGCPYKRITTSRFEDGKIIKETIFDPEETFKDQQADTQINLQKDENNHGN